MACDDASVSIFFHSSTTLIWAMIKATYNRLKVWLRLRLKLKIWFWRLFVFDTGDIPSKLRSSKAQHSKRNRQQI